MRRTSGILTTSRVKATYPAIESRRNGHLERLILPLHDRLAQPFGQGLALAHLENQFVFLDEVKGSGIGAGQAAGFREDNP